MESAEARRLKLRAMRVAAVESGNTGRPEGNAARLCNPLASDGSPDNKVMQSSFQFRHERSNSFTDGMRKAPAMMGVSFSSPVGKNGNQKSGGSGLLGVGPSQLSSSPYSPTPGLFAPAYDRLSLHTASSGCQLASPSQSPSGLPFTAVHGGSGAFQQTAGIDNACPGGGVNGWFSPLAMSTGRPDGVHSVAPSLSPLAVTPSSSHGRSPNASMVGGRSFSSPSFRSPNGSNNKSNSGRSSMLANCLNGAASCASFPQNVQRGGNGGGGGGGGVTPANGSGSMAGGWRGGETVPFRYSGLSSPTADRDFNHSGRRLSRGPKALRTCGSGTPSAVVSSPSVTNYFRYVKKSMMEDPWAQLECLSFTENQSYGSPVSSTLSQSRVEGTPGSAESALSFGSRAGKTTVLLPSPVQMRDLQGVASPIIKAGLNINEIKTSETVPSGSLRFTSAVPEMVADGKGW